MKPKNEIQRGLSCYVCGEEGSVSRHTQRPFIDIGDEGEFSWIECSTCGHHKVVRDDWPGDGKHLRRE